MSASEPPQAPPILATGRGSSLELPNRFDRIGREIEWDQLADDPEFLAERARPATQFFADQSQSIVSENDSPDIPFRYSVNPYRGCEHGCAYCYARPTHEYLGHNAGIDFETRIFVKQRAPELLREWLSRPKYQPEQIMFSGVTDCYQPAERHFQLTRACLAVASQFGQPISIVTKNALVCRDLDLLEPLAARGLAHVSLSITTLDAELARRLEPRTSTPAARLRAIRELSAAGVPVRVMLAPLIPGLNDQEIPALLAAVREQGATDARYTMLRLPLAVEPVFREWLAREQPLRQSRVEGLIQQVRGGQWNRSEFGERMRGTGPIAEQLRALFRLMRQRYGFADLPPLVTNQFAVPIRPGQQRTLF